MGVFDNFTTRGRSMIPLAVQCSDGANFEPIATNRSTQLLSGWSYPRLPWPVVEYRCYDFSDCRSYIVNFLSTQFNAEITRLLCRGSNEVNALRDYGSKMTAYRAHHSQLFRIFLGHSICFVLTKIHRPLIIIHFKSTGRILKEIGPRLPSGESWLARNPVFIAMNYSSSINIASMRLKDKQMCPQ